MTQLSRNFSLQEACKSQTAERLGIDNAAPVHIIPNLKRVAENILQPVRDQFGPFTPSSWYRCLELNRAIGSRDTSQHVKGCAADFEVPGLSNRDLAEWIHDNLDFDQLILEFHELDDPSSGWVHCSYISAQDNRGEAFTIQRDGTLNGGFPK